MLHIIPAAVILVCFTVYIACLSDAWNTMRIVHKISALGVLFVIFAAAAVSSASFLAAAFGPA